MQSGIEEGAKCVLDGRSLQVSGFEKGNFIGPTILTDVTVSCVDVIYELFGLIQENLVQLMYVDYAPSFIPRFLNFCDTAATPLPQPP